MSKLNLIEKLVVKMRDVDEHILLSEIDRIGDLEQTDRDGRTLLINAAFYGKEMLVGTLLARGASINTADRTGFTALHAAVQESHVRIVEALLNAGADVNAQNAFGNTPIWLLKPTAPRSLVELLLNHGADPSIKNNYGVSVVDKMTAYPEIKDVLLRRLGG